MRDAIARFPSHALARRITIPVEAGDVPFVALPLLACILMENAARLQHVEHLGLYGKLVRMLRLLALHWHAMLHHLAALQSLLPGRF